MAEKERTALKWTIGIISFVVWVAVGRGVILSDGAGYDSIEQEWVMSTGQQWAMVLWTAAMTFGAVKIYKIITRPSNR